MYYVCVSPNLPCEHLIISRLCALQHKVNQAALQVIGMTDFYQSNHLFAHL